jgi:hypothetical protein
LALLSATEQLRRIEDQLIGTGGALIEEPLGSISPGDRDGFLRLGLRYPSGHRFHVYLRLDVTPGYPLWTSYRFHLQDADGRCVFRYDCSPHYPDLATFPHHKHVGEAETAEEHPLPTLRGIVEEVLHWVGS